MTDVIVGDPHLSRPALRSLFTEQEIKDMLECADERGESLEELVREAVLSDLFR